jgi:antitoxin component HigA of HigAB toxin-antitoxin module
MESRDAIQTDFDEIDDVESWNAEDADDLERPENPGDYNISVAARDWTVATMVEQVRQGNIDLDPAFQRRNAWRDQRRSRLIESFILGFPVPQIVLAENPNQRRSYIVIDGKQRLMTIAGLYLPDYRNYWTQPKFSGLNVLKELNRIHIDAFLHEPSYTAERRQLENADIRTTVIAGFQNEGVLYDIFYRINTGSVPLSSQELRQVLNRGNFAKYLLELTSVPNALWQILNISEPDPRLRDVELLLRLVAWRRFSRKYIGNMKPFLDDTMKFLNKTWASEQESTEKLVSELMQGVEALNSVFGDKVGRKFKDGRFETSLNRALFEVQAYYFSFPPIRETAQQDSLRLIEAFKELSEDKEFQTSIEVTTKSIDHYRTRFGRFREMLHNVLGVQPEILHIGDDGKRK